MNVPFLDLSAACRDIAPDIEAALIDVARHGPFVMGPALRKFEADFAAFSDAHSCVGVANGLDALRVSLLAMGVVPGDEVIVPSHTYIATWLAVSQCGAVPVPVEPVEATFNIDPEQVEAAITDRTKVIIAVHLYGQPADLDSLRDLATKHGLALLEDAAQAHGARYKGARIGSKGTATFSFYPSKNLGALGDGGALLTDSDDIARDTRLFRNYGSDVKYVHKVKGINSRLDPIQAAVLSVKLRVLDSWNERRRQIADRYSQAFAKIGITPPFVPNWAEPVWHLYVLRHKDRDAFQKRLQDAGISTVIHYPTPPHLQGAYVDMGCGKGSFPLAEILAEEVISLPMCPAQSDESTDYVIEMVEKLY